MDEVDYENGLFLYSYSSVVIGDVKEYLRDRPNSPNNQEVCYFRIGSALNDGSIKCLVWPYSCYVRDRIPDFTVSMQNL